MKKWISLSLLVVLLLFVSACSNEESSNSTNDTKDSTKTEETTDTTTEETESEEPAEETVATSGEEVFKQSCVTCHSSGDIAGGQAKLDATKIKTDFKEKADLQEFVSTKMPKNAPGSLSAEEYESVVNYLWEQQ